MMPIIIARKVHDLLQLNNANANKAIKKIKLEFSHTSESYDEFINRMKQIYDNFDGKTFEEIEDMKTYSARYVTMKK